MTNLDGGFEPLAQDPATSLKGKGLPWPVYLAIGLAVVAVLGFLGLRSYQNRERRKVHVRFMEQFQDFERNEVSLFWRCLFGKEGEARLRGPDDLNMQLENALFTDYKSYPDKVQTECVPKATKAADKIKRLDPLPPQDYDAALDKYSKALAGLANSINTWAEGAPKRVESRLKENKVKSAGDAWNGTANLKKPDPEALKYDQFLRCAAPDLEKYKTGQELLQFLAEHCVGKKTDPEYLAKLRDKCIPKAQEAPDKAPKTFAKVLQAINPDYDRLTQAFDSCFRSMNKLAKRDDLIGAGKAFAEAVNASTEVKKIGKENLKDE
jgi:hypothetical protein